MNRSIATLYRTHCVLQYVQECATLFNVQHCANTHFCFDIYTLYVKHSQTLCLYWCVSDTVCQHCVTLYMFLQCLAVLARSSVRAIFDIASKIRDIKHLL